jgi:tRNA threonylcarbamoyladenosine modification (KEOPS) complex  Pcc1 subunit
MTNKAAFIFEFPSHKSASIVVAALSPEISHKIPKSTVSFSVTDKKLTLTIETDEVSSLRAASNSYLRWIQTALAVEELV